MIINSKDMGAYTIELQANTLLGHDIYTLLVYNPVSKAIYLADQSLFIDRLSKQYDSFTQVKVRRWEMDQ